MAGYFIAPAARSALAGILDRPRANPGRVLIAKPRPPRRYAGPFKSWHARMIRMGLTPAAATAAIEQYLKRSPQ